MTYAVADPGGAPQSWDRRSIGALLRARSVRGLRLWPQSPAVEEFQSAASDNDWVYAHLDTTSAVTKHDYLRCCRTDLSLPGYVGHNWDGLEESLGDLPDTWPIRRRGALVVWTGWSTLADADSAAFQTALSIWRDTVASWLETGDAAVVLSLSAREVPVSELHQVASVPRIRYPNDLR